MPAMPENRQILIASLPPARSPPSDYELRTRRFREPGDGEVLVRTLAFTIGAGQRAGLQGSASYAGAPTTGIVMDGTGVARVEASNVTAFAAGDLVVGADGMAGLRRADRGRPTRVDADVDPALHLFALGTNGLTAYFGMVDVGPPQAGETVVVSAASGSVGHLAGQIARMQGCRVVGVTGSDAKCELLTGRLGFDAAVNHRDATFRDDFKAATGDGIDVYFDNTGGDILAPRCAG